MDVSAIRLSARCDSVRRKPLPYLRGPITWQWLLTAMKLPGAAIKVGLVLWHFRSLNKSLTFRKGTGDIARFLGLSTDTVRRAMHALEDAGLIEVDCAPGRKCTITMVDFAAITTNDSCVTRDESSIQATAPDAEPRTGATE